MLAGPTTLGAAVLTVTVTGTEVVVLLRVAELGLTLHVAPVGKPLQVEELKLTVPLKPSTELTFTVSVPELPALDILTAGLVADIAQFGPQAFARFAAFTLPRPVARSYPMPALYPGDPFA